MDKALSGEALTESESDLLLRSQLMSMYFVQAPEYRRLSSETSGGSTPLTGTSRRWQRSLNKMISINRVQSLR
jgi:hypothetical protein